MNETLLGAVDRSAYASPYADPAYWQQRTQTYVLDIAFDPSSRAVPKASDTQATREFLRQAIGRHPKHWGVTQREQEFLQSMVDSVHEGEDGGLRMSVSVAPGSPEQHDRFTSLLQAKAGYRAYLMNDGREDVRVDVLYARAGEKTFVDHLRTLSRGQGWDMMERNRAWVETAGLGALRGQAPATGRLKDVEPGDLARIRSKLQTAAITMGLWRGGVANLTGSPQAANEQYAAVLHPAALAGHYALGNALGWPAHESFMHVAAVLEDPAFSALDLRNLCTLAQDPEQAELAPWPMLPSGRLPVQLWQVEQEHEMQRVELSVGEHWLQCQHEQHMADAPAGSRPAQASQAMEALQVLGRCALAQAALVAPGAVREHSSAPWSVFGLKPEVEDLLLEAQRVLTQYDEHTLSEDDMEALETTEEALRDEGLVPAGSALERLADQCRGLGLRHEMDGLTILEFEGIRSALKAVDGAYVPVPCAKTLAAGLIELVEEAENESSRAAEIAQVLARVVEQVAQADGDPDKGEAFSPALPALRLAIAQAGELATELKFDDGECGEVDLDGVVTAWSDLAQATLDNQWETLICWRPGEVEDVAEGGPRPGL